MHFGASRFFLTRNGAWARAAESGFICLTRCFRSTTVVRTQSGTTFAALRHVKIKLNWGFAFAFGLLASLALPSGAAEAIVSAVAWVEDLHIAEFAVAANALTIVP